MIIVLEGLDGSGKSTQGELIVNNLCKLGINSSYKHFPMLKKDNAFGILLSKLLSGDFGKLGALNPYLNAMLFAADQFSGKNEISKNDEVVILDRYFYSNMAYQSANLTSEDEKLELIKWIEQASKDFLMPNVDLVFYFDVPESFRKLGLKNKVANDRHDIYEERFDFQQKVTIEYKKLASKYNFVTINCNNSNNSDNHMLGIEEVNKLIMQHIINYMEVKNVYRSSRF
jgi:dTMP kinase